MKGESWPAIPTVDTKRSVLLGDVHGFTVRSQHLQTYRLYSTIYKEEEEERSKRWKDFLDRLGETAEVPFDSSVGDEDCVAAPNVAGGEDNDQNGVSECGGPEEVATESRGNVRTHKAHIWKPIRPSLLAVEQMMSYRVKKRRTQSSDEEAAESSGSCHALTEEESRGVGIPQRGSSEDESISDVERLDAVKEASSSADLSLNDASYFPWKDELESLVHGGVPRALRGELWQAFVGVRARKIEGYYDKLLVLEAEGGNGKEHESSNANVTDNMSNIPQNHIPEIWKAQIEKDLPRTFPGHPALNKDGRNALRRLLMAYTRHNPAVGYCQGMNFFAGLLLLLMPEENAFWTLVGIIDDYFEGYYSEEMIDSQVDQLVLEDLVRERFPKSVNHLDYLGVQVAWITGPWFLSIFVNMLPWESVLRVWDVLLFDGNRVMLFRTALALMELYDPAMETTKDAEDAVTLLQSLASSTFDSSQLVLTACMGYQSVNQMKLEHLRKKHRPEVIAVMEERSKERKDSQGLASILHRFKHSSDSLLTEPNSTPGSARFLANGDLDPFKSELAEGHFSGLTVDGELDSVPDLKEQVTCLKVELCGLLEEKRSAVVRAEELETALMEMVNQDNRRLLSVKVEQLEQEVSALRQAFADKQEKENAMLQALMLAEEEQKVTKDTRMLAEQDVAAQKYAVHMLQDKYEETMAALEQMEKRAVTAETMLQATLQNQSSPPPSSPRILGFLSRGLGWLDKQKGKPDASSEGRISCDAPPKSPSVHRDTNGL